MDRLADFQREHFNKMYLEEEFRKYYYYVCYNTAKLIYKIIKETKNKNLRILDIGCGIGIVDYFVSLLSNDFSKLIGIDISENGIAKAKLIVKDSRIEFAVMDYNNASQFGKFDLIIATEFIEHLSDIKKFFSTINHILVKDGILFISTPNRLRLQNRILMLFGKKPVLCDFSHTREYSFYELEKILEDNGFKIVKHKSHGLWGGWIVYYIFRFFPDKWKEKIAFTPFFRGEVSLNYHLGGIFKNFATFMYIVARKL